MMGESSARFRQFHDAARTATMRDASGIGLADIEERARALGGTRCAARIMRGGGCSCPFPKRTMMRQRPQQRRRTYDASRNRR